MGENFSKPNETASCRSCVEVTGGTVESCTNTPVDIKGIDKKVIAKIPVVLAEFNVQFNVSAHVTLPERALEIKNIKNNLKITQCLLIQDSNMLFIKGFVRKNIDYSTVNYHSNNEGVCGKLNHCTVDIPFECTTPVEFNGFCPEEIMPNTSQEFEFFRRKELPMGFAEKDKLLSGDLSEYNQVSTEYYNELPYCELVSSRIIQYDEYLDRQLVNDGPLEEHVFRKIEEKMVINTVIRILQNRNVEIDPGIC